MDYLSLCLICKDENDYLPEWLDYHILMGVDRFYIYDNESRISLRESLKDYIERGWVVVIDIVGKAMQLNAYDHCLQTFGPYTFWMGFIDTDEFLVTKTVLDLKELLKKYEAFGGLAVSSLFFGSNGHQTRPTAGQISAYTRRTHETFMENDLIKSIVQPRQTSQPVSPHDFAFNPGNWCVNEKMLQVVGQHFPNYIELIQLNHYFCRSESEIDLKLQRGRGAMNAAWPRKRFNAVNSMSAYEDTQILQNLDLLIQKAERESPGRLTANQNLTLTEKMAALAGTRRPTPLEIDPPQVAMDFRDEFSAWRELRAQCTSATESGDYKQVCQILLRMIQLQPQHAGLYTDLANNYLLVKNMNAAWQALGQAWQLAPNNYLVLLSMSYYFMSIRDYLAAEKVCRLLLELAPHSLMILGFLAEALIGQERFEEALSVGVPVVELSAKIGELPDRMGVILVKKMADYLLEKKDYAGAVHLWEAGVDCQPRDVNAMLELTQALMLAGDKAGARHRLAQARILAKEEGLAAQNEVMISLQKKMEASTTLPAQQPRKRRHR